MAEGNANRPAPDDLTTEDVDRLSERFKPSWETEAQPAPQATRPVLKQTMLGGTAPAAPLPTARAAPPAAASPPAAAPAPVAARPLTTVTVGTSGVEAPKNQVRHATLVGIAPQAIRQVSGAPQTAPDDLDWELPEGEQPEPPSDMAQTARIVRAPEVSPPKAEASRIQQVQPEQPKAAPVIAVVAPVVTASAQAPAPAQAPPPAAAEADEPMAIDVEELPPKSQPSGIGEKYVPRDQNAPAVVLNAEVERTEAQARATIEAQHRARSAPTIAKMPAVRVAAQAAITEFADEDTVSHRRKSKHGVWVVLALLTLGGGAAGAAVLLGQPAPAPVDEKAVEKPLATQAAAPPPPLVAAEPKAPEPVAAASPEPVPSVAAVPDPPKAPPTQPAKVAAAAPSPERPVEAAKSKAAATARPAKPKPASTGKASSGASPRPSRPSVIVRDNPF